MNEILKQVKEIAEKMLNKKFEPLTNLEIPKKQGVYIIKEKSNRLFENKIFYVGKSSKLFNRLIRQHSSNSNNVSGSILKRKLNRRGLQYNEIGKYLREECLVVIEAIENYDINSLVEDLLIATLRKKGEPLLNELK